MKLLTVQLSEISRPPLPLKTFDPDLVRAKVWEPTAIGALTVVIPAGTLMDTGAFDPELVRVWVERTDGRKTKVVILT